MPSKKIFIQNYSTPIGELIIGSFNNELCLCDWKYRKMRSRIDDGLKQMLNAEFVEKSTEIISETIFQLNDYFEGVRREFELPLKLSGSDFQVKVWRALMEIPYGKTDSYLGLSKKLGDEKAIRAVAGANGTNRLAIIIPCHRIIGSSGELTGYAGGLSAKKKLLELEGSLKRNAQMNLF